ncbi:MAG: transposase [Syntrophorhabdaceae bacterium]|nr:transposase [Syntrophorhabdaceae bacterium]
MSMDGRNRFMDNIFIERLLKTIKYEEAKAYGSISHAKKELARFFDRYNTRRPHQGLNDRTPYGSLLWNITLRLRMRYEGRTT